MNQRATNDAFAVRTEPTTIRMERVLPGSAERLWSYLVDAEKREKWFCGGDTLTRGSSATLLFQHSRITSEPTPEKYTEMDRGGMKSEVKVLEFDPPRLLSYTWPSSGYDSEVTFELFPEGRDVRLVLTHRRLADVGDMRDFSGGWHAHFDALADLLAGRKPNGFWANVARLDKEYQRRLGA